jgi:hypothetical protein
VAHFVPFCGNSRIASQEKNQNNCKSRIVSRDLQKSLLESFSRGFYE